LIPRSVVARFGGAAISSMSKLGAVASLTRASALGEDRTSMAEPERKSMCHAFCTFLVFGMVLVPMGVMVVCALFALPLTLVECADARETDSSETDGRRILSTVNSEATVSTGSSFDVDTMCNYYEWWLYILGNVVGVGGLTEVGPISGHYLAEMFDIVIAVWSLTIAGLVIGSTLKESNMRLEDTRIEPLRGSARVYDNALG
jgi:hypothetical protein